MYKFTKQHKTFAVGDVCTYTGDYLQALIDAGIVEEVKQGLKGMPSMKMVGHHDAFHYLDSSGNICTELMGEGADKMQFDFGNYFDEMKAAQEAQKHFIARTELIRACHEISGGENGWRDDSDNWNAIYDYCDNELSFTASEYQQSNESFLHLRTSDQAQRLINEHGDALKIYLGVN